MTIHLANDRNFEVCRTKPGATAQITHDLGAFDCNICARILEKSLSPNIWVGAVGFYRPMCLVCDCFLDEANVAYVTFNEKTRMSCLDCGVTLGHQIKRRPIDTRPPTSSVKPHIIQKNSDF